MSCIIASYIDPRVAYVHHTFNKFEHSDLTPKESESFLNLFNSYSLKSDLLKQKEIKLENTRLNDGAPDFWLNMVNNNSIHVCNQSAIYSFDNCWVYIYNSKVVNNLYDKALLEPIRKLYNANSKPKPFFDSNRFNIVIHIRRQDAGIIIIINYNDNYYYHYNNNNNYYYYYYY